MAIQNKVKNIAELLGVPESTVCLVLYAYLTETVQEILLDNKSNTLFGEMQLNENNELELIRKKFGLIELLGKDDIKMIYKICKDGPDYTVF